MQTRALVRVGEWSDRLFRYREMSKIVSGQVIDSCRRTGDLLVSRTTPVLVIENFWSAEERDRFQARHGASSGINFPGRGPPPSGLSNSGNWAGESPGLGAIIVSELEMPYYSSGISNRS